MHTVTSFHASAVAPHQASAIVAEYLALERARIYRRLFVARFGLLAFVLGVAGIGLHWLPPAASWSGLGMCVMAPAATWLAELRCNWRLARRLEGIPNGVQQTVVPPQA